MARNKSGSDGEFWADKLMDLANLAIVVLVLGQLVAPKIYWIGIGIGILLYGLLIIISAKMRRR